MTHQGSTEIVRKFDKTWFIQSRVGNIKDEYFFEKKLGSGGYGAVYLARNKQTGTLKYVDDHHRRYGRGQGHAEGQNHRLRVF